MKKKFKGNWARHLIGRKMDKKKIGMVRVILCHFIVCTHLFNGIFKLEFKFSKLDI